MQFARSTHLCPRELPDTVSLCDSRRHPEMHALMCTAPVRDAPAAAAHLAGAQGKVPSSRAWLRDSAGGGDARSPCAPCTGRVERKGAAAVTHDRSSAPTRPDMSPLTATPPQRSLRAIGGCSLEAECVLLYAVRTVERNTLDNSWRTPDGGMVRAPRPARH
jgi:hypothetical protein